MEKKSLEVLDVSSWEQTFPDHLQARAIQALEGGKVVFFPHLSFMLTDEERTLLRPDKVDPRSKNISYDIRRDRLGNTVCSDEEATVLKELIKRYALCSKKLLDTLFPHYTATIKQAKTSLRPVEIQGRPSSYRKDDSRLHVDSFPSSPVKGYRILRLFTNINPDGKSRVWRTGEPFPEVINKIAPRVSPPRAVVARLLSFLKVTKGLRSPYDHYMLQIHDTMKADTDYQQSAPQEEIHFPPGSSWMVYTDQVSHAAMSGQHVLEQTFYLPPHGLKEPSTSPLAQLEKYFSRQLVPRS